MNRQLQERVELTKRLSHQFHLKKLPVLLTQQITHRLGIAITDNMVIISHETSLISKNQSEKLLSYAEFKPKQRHDSCNKCRKKMIRGDGRKKIQIRWIPVTRKQQLTSISYKGSLTKIVSKKMMKIVTIPSLDKRTPTRVGSVTRFKPKSRPFSTRNRKRALVTC